VQSPASRPKRDIHRSTDEQAMQRTASVETHLADGSPVQAFASRLGTYGFWIMPNVAVRAMRPRRTWSTNDRVIFRLQVEEKLGALG
jgi:hypothetical protein